MLHRNNVALNRVVDARKEAMAGEEAWSLLAGVKEVVVAKGKNHLVFAPHKDSKEDILQQILGRTATLRAPSLLIGDRLLVGYSDAMYAHYVG